VHYQFFYITLGLYYSRVLSTCYKNQSLVSFRFSCVINSRSV